MLDKIDAVEAERFSLDDRVGVGGVDRSVIATGRAARWPAEQSELHIASPTEVLCANGRARRSARRSE
jgi:hypothetical protein